MKKLKILILSWLFPPSTGGLESYCYNLAKNLAKHHKIVVFTTGKKYRNEKKELFKVYRVKEMYPYGNKTEDYALLKKKFKQVLTEEKVDVIHSHNLICLPTKFSSSLINASRELNIPLLEHCHDARYKNLNPLLAKKDFNKIIAISNFVKNRLIEIGVAKNKIIILGNSVDSSLFNSLRYSKEKSKKYFNLPQNKKIIIFPSRAIRTSTGKFGRQKRFLTLFNAAKEIKKYRNDFCVVFPIKVGLKENPNERKKTLDYLNSEIKRGGIEKNIIWIKKRITLNEMPVFYSAADIMCTPSVDEAFGLVFVESMFMGVPPIGAKSGATPEIITHGKNGFLINPGDSKTLAKIIINLMGDEQLRRRIGKNARKFALSKFSYNSFIKHIEKIYYALLKNENILS
jgi:glycosyltransferase involved in cell wall biosynthesis